MEGERLQYLDFVDLKYKPKKTDLVCSFYLENKGISFKKAAGGIAAESSIGTWTELTTMKPYMEYLAAKVFQIKGKTIKIAYPIDLFEDSNMPNVLSGIAGNLFGLKELKNVRLLDIEFPEKLVKSFKGPKYGIEGIRKTFKVKRPLLGTIVKPKLGLNYKDHAKVAFEAWLGGCDIVKDDENLASQRFNPWLKRLNETLKLKEKAEKITGEKKGYLFNVTTETNEMLKRAKTAEKLGSEYIMVDILTTGFSALQTLRNADFNLIIHAHRAGHAAITKNEKHGIKMSVIAKIVRLIGLDQLHVGTAVGKMSEGKKEVKENIQACKKKMANKKTVMPVASGGLQPLMIPELLQIFGKDVIIQLGGGIHGNPLGTQAGAKAARDALEATLEGIPLNEKAKQSKELMAAIKKWR